MKYIMPEASSDSPQLRLIEAPEDSPLDDIRVELETEARISRGASKSRRILGRTQPSRTEFHPPGSLIHVQALRKTDP